MLFMHNNKYLPLTGLLTLLQWIIHKDGKKHSEIFLIFQKYFMKYFMAKNFMKFYITTYNAILWSLVFEQCNNSYVFSAASNTSYV